MHRPIRPWFGRSVALVATLMALLAAGAGCSDDNSSRSATPTTLGSTTTSLGTDPELEAMLLEPADLPPGFSVETGADGADTISSFCLTEDPAAGLQASGRALVRMRRDPLGVALLQLVFRFRGDGAGTFVQQAEDIFERCNEVPDGQGLAFSYEPAAAGIDETLAGTDGAVARFGASVGSGSFSENIAVFRRGDVAQLVAVLALDTPRAEVDALAEAAVRAAVARLD